MLKHIVMWKFIDGALGQSLEIEGHVEMKGVECPAQFFPVRQGFQAFLVDIDDLVNIGPARQDRRKLFMDSPDDAGIGTILPQCIERRQGMEDVAERAHLDDQYILICFHGLSFLRQ